MKAIRLVFFIAMRQIWSHKLLNGIAVLGVSLGVLTLIAMNAIMAGFQERFKGEIVRVSPHITIFDKEVGRDRRVLRALFRGEVVADVSHEQPSDRITRIKRPTDLIRAIEAMPEVEAACAGIVGQAIVSIGNKDLGVDMRGIHAEAQERCTPMSTYMQNGSWRLLDTRSDGIVIGSGVAGELGAHLGDKLRLVSPGGSPILLTVVAIFDVGIPPIDKTRIYVSLNTAQSVLRRPNIISRIEVRLHDASRARDVAARIEAASGYDAESWQEQNANFLSLFDMQNLIIGMVIAAILVVSGFGILAIQIMLVLQKTRDISILRSVGLRRRDILWTFLLQGMVISLIGAAIGDLAGWRLVDFLGTLEIKSEGLIKSSKFLVSKDPRFYVYGVLFALLVGSIASLLPAWRGSRVEPVDVLRGQFG